jgi:hypothetical protein
MSQQLIPPINWPKLAALVRSRKFWTLVASLAATGGAYATGEISAWQALIAAITALSVYAGATAVEDGLARSAIRR